MSMRTRFIFLMGLSLALAGWAQGQALTLEAIGNRAEDLEAGGTIEAARQAAFQAQYLRRAADWGLSLRGDGNVLFSSSATDPAAIAQPTTSATLTVAWELLEGGLGESRMERLRLMRLREATALEAEDARAAVRLSARIEALSMAQAEIRARGYAEATQRADSVVRRMRGLYEQRDVLRSDLMAVELVRLRYGEESTRQQSLALRYRNELARRLRIDPSFAFTPPEGLPPVLSDALLNRQIETQALRYGSASVRLVPTPAWATIRLTLYGGVVVRDFLAPIDDVNNPTAFQSGPRMGLRFSIPFDYLTRSAAAAREAMAFRQQQEARVEQERRGREQAVRQALLELHTALATYDRLRAEQEVEEMRLAERRLQAEEGGLSGMTRLTPNELLLFEAETLVRATQAEAQRLEAWRQYVLLSSLAAIP